MKRLVFAFMALIALSSCSIDDDTANTSYELAEITGNDLPDSFEFGKSYSVEIDYILPSECNTFTTVDAKRAGSVGVDRTEIYVGVVTTLNENANCDANTIGDAGSSNFSITIDENDSYTFYFWTSEDVDGQPVYTEVVVPVLETLPSGD